MTETRIRVEPARFGKVAMWFGVAGGIMAGLGIFLGLFSYTDGRFDKLEDAIQQGFHDAEISRATSADDLNARIGFYTGLKMRELHDE